MKQPWIPPQRPKQQSKPHHLHSGSISWGYWTTCNYNPPRDNVEMRAKRAPPSFWRGATQPTAPKWNLQQHALSTRVLRCAQKKAHWIQDPVQRDWHFFSWVLVHRPRIPGQTHTQKKKLQDLELFAMAPPRQAADHMGENLRMHTMIKIIWQVMQMKVTKIAQAVRKQPSSLCATWLDTAFSAKQFAQSTKGHASTKKRGVKTMLTNELQAT